MIQPGALGFELACAPNEQNYVTVKLWGPDRDRGMLFLLDPVGDSFSPSHISEWPELDYMN